MTQILKKNNLKEKYLKYLLRKAMSFRRKFNYFFNAHVLYIIIHSVNKRRNKSWNYSLDQKDLRYIKQTFIILKI